MELSPRLRSVAGLVPPGARFADVGTDHAYLPVWLLQQGIIEHALVSDLRPGPLDRARSTAARYGLAERMEFRLCDGLSGIAPAEADTIAIAGMGGETIAAILAAAPWVREQGCLLLLQPMSAQSALRPWLQRQGYRIEREHLSREAVGRTAEQGNGGSVAAGIFDPLGSPGCPGRNGTAPLHAGFRCAAVGGAGGRTSWFGENERGVEYMATVREIYQLLNTLAPFSIQMEFDNAGFLVGRGDQAVDRILVSLDITEPVVSEAAERGAQLIVSHHPVLFHPARSITDGDPTGRILLALVERKIAAICAHTNLDAAQGGVNDCLARALELDGVELLCRDGTDGQGRPYGIGRIGNTVGAPMYAPAFAAFVKRQLGANGVRYVDARRPVRRVAVGGGACADLLSDALALGCDTFVTADVKYNGFLDAKALGINLIDAGHYPTEQVVVPVLAKWLSDAFPKVEVFATDRHKEAFSYG